MSYPKKEDISVATMTLISKLNVNIHIQSIIQNIKLETGKIENIKSGNKKEVQVDLHCKSNLSSPNEKKITPESLEQKVRKNKKKKKNFYNQVTIIVKPFPERKNGVNMKLSENGSIQMTGTTSIEEGHLTIKKMIEFLNEWSPNIFYKKEIKVPEEISTETTQISTETTQISTETTEISTETTEISTETKNYDYLTFEETKQIQILSTNCELIIISFEFPFFIHLQKFNQILKTKYQLLSILGTSSYPGINTKITYSKECTHMEHIKKKKKYLCNCRDMSIFTFRTGKVIITGFESLEKIYTIFDQYVNMVQAEESIIKIEKEKIEKMSKSLDSKITKKRSKLMKVGNKTFEVVDEF